ncbi:MAG: Hint domain-containing protein [Alphaproteobacteria bacterium]|nr:Hint domain-containing protein [Alphaproteobacteria bacterium]
MSGKTYVWVPLGSGAWSDPKDWEQTDPPIPPPGLPTPAGPPGASDIAYIDTDASVSGDGSASILSVDLSTVTFTGNISADRVFVVASTTAPATPAEVIVSGGLLSTTNELSVGFDATLEVTDAGTADGPASAGASAQFDNYGLVTLTDTSRIDSNTLFDFGTLAITSGLVDVGTMEVASFDDPGGGPESGSLDIAGGGSLTDTLGIIGNSQTDDSAVTLTGGNWDNLQLLIGSAAAATVSVSNDSTVTVGGGFTVVAQVPEALGVGEGVFGTGGLQPGHGTLSVDGVGSRVSVTGDVAIGHGGAGFVTLANGGLLDASGSLDAANGTGSSAAITVTGGGALFQIGAGATVGDSGAATLTVDSGGSFTVADSLDVAASAGSSGSIVIDGGLLTVAADARLGDGGDGSLTLSAGGTVQIIGTLTEGVQSGSSGTLLADDPADQFSIGGDWTIGVAGAHSDTLQGGLSADVSGALALGAQSGGAGTLTLSGLSSTLSVEGATLAVGGGGTGSLHLADGASLSAFSASLTAGASAGATGVIALDGANSTLTIGHDLTLGDAGAGTIDVAARNTLVLGDGAFVLGAAATGAGVLSIAGDGNSLTVAADATIGAAGSGSVDLQAGTTLDASSGNIVLGAQAHAAGTITLGGSAAEATTMALTVGGGGAGMLGIGADATVDASGDVRVGASLGGGGTLTVASGAELSVGGNLTVGDGGQGSLDVNGGSLDMAGAGDLVIGNVASANADVTIAHSTIDFGNIVKVGNAGTATLSVSTGGSIDAVTIAIGSGFNGNGAFVLDGTGAAASSNMLTVGGDGVASLEVTDKAVLSTSGNASIATASTPVQQAVSVGSKGIWSVAGVLDIGKSGAAQVVVDSGANVAAPTMIIGDAAGAEASLAVSGASGSTTSEVGFGTLLVVGKSGSGTLTIAQGASADAGAAHTGTVEIALSASASGGITLSDSGSVLTTALLTVGGGKTAAGGTGTLAIGAGAVVAADTVTVWGSGVVALSGGTLDPDPVSNAGSIGGFGTVEGAVANTGTITAHDGTLLLTGAVDGAGRLGVQAGATLELQQAVAATQTIAFAGGALVLDDLAAAQGTLEDFATGDRIVLKDVVADGGSFAGGVLTLTEGGSTVGTLALAGSYGADGFRVQNSVGTTEVTVPCFAAGTRIATATGEVPVERLRAGDVVRLADGGRAVVRWVGHRRVACRRHPRPQDVMPVRVRAHAFGFGHPTADVRLSPDHAVFADGVLIPIRYLLNGATIVQEFVAAITYWHVELARHAVLLAQGLAAESYLDTGNRAAFANGGAAAMAHPDFARGRWRHLGCAPLVMAGAERQAVRRAVLEQAIALGHRLTGDAAITLRAAGRDIAPLRHGPSLRFALPRGSRRVHLTSRSWVPAETDPASDDRRRLGVAVTWLAFDGARVPLDDPRLGAGWHAAEPDWRWSDGDAAIATQGARTLSVGLAMTGRYWLRAGRDGERVSASVA